MDIIIGCANLTIRSSVDIDPPAAEAWKLFGEGFGDWADWAPRIDSSALEGPLSEGVVRVNDTASLGTVRQELACFDRDGRTLAFGTIGVPGRGLRLERRMRWQ